MYRKALERPRERSRAFERNGRTRIPRDEGRTRFIESMILLSSMLVLAIALALAVGLPLAMMLSEICVKLKC